MKLLRLKIDESFRSLQAGFEMHFLREWERSESFDPAAPYVLAGPNGSGKSNVLEVLAAIFYHLECQYLENRPELFDYDEESNPLGFRAEQAFPSGFELEYLIPVPPAWAEKGQDNTANIKVIKPNNSQSGARFYWLNHPDHGDTQALPRGMAKDMLPEFVLGYSSGENEILSLPFFKMRFIQFDEYLDCLKHETDYPGKPESRLTFLDNDFSQAILFCNLLFQDDVSLTPFRQDVGVESVQQFRIILKKSIEISAEETDQYPPGFIRALEDIGESQYFLPILDRFEASSKSADKFDPVINRLQRCATSYFHDVETDTLYLDYWVNEATKEAFKMNFESPLDLFQCFQILLTLNLYPVSDALKQDLYGSDSVYVQETVPTLPSDERVMRFKFVKLIKRDVSEAIMLKDLSDGEHQFLHSLGLCLLYKNSNSLFLLDEPETHFNPDWRSQLISRLRECFAKAESTDQRELLITTHTPFLISDSRPEQVLIFKKEDGKVSVSRPDYNTLGASINKITFKTFDKRETIGGYAQEILEGLKKRFDAGEDRNQLLDEVDRQLGDSVEKVLLVKTILDSLDEGAD